MIILLAISFMNQFYFYHLLVVLGLSYWSEIWVKIYAQNLYTKFVHNSTCPEKKKKKKEGKKTSKQGLTMKETSQEAKYWHSSSP